MKDETIVYVKQYQTSQELVMNEPIFCGKLDLKIILQGRNTEQQEKIKEHILKEVKRICSELSTSPIDFWYTH